MDVILRDFKTWVTEELWEGDNVAAVEDPLLCKCVAVAVDACGLHASTLVVLIEHMIAGAFRELLTEDVTEEKVVIAFMLSVFQVLGEDIDHSSI